MAVFKDSNCFLLDLVNKERLVFQFAPHMVQDNHSTGLKVIGVAGVDVPKIAPYLTSGRDLSFTLDFVADDDTRDESWVVKQISFLQSLTYLTRVSESPEKMALPVCFLVLGSFVELPIYVSRCNVTWGPFSDRRMLPIKARAALTLVQAPTPEFIGAVAARGGKAMRRSLSFTTP